MNVLSLFDGISCCQQALKKVEIPYDKCYASEIHKPSIKVTQHNFPRTEQLGDIRNINSNKLKRIDLITAGSPCQDFSIAGRKKGMSTIDNIEIVSFEQYMDLKNNNFEFIGQSHLFWEFIRLLKETNPKFFFLENVTMSQKWEDVITNTLGVKPIKLNSSLVSAQNRERLYWTNIPLTPIVDKQIMIHDVIPNAVAGAGLRGRLNKELLQKGIRKYDYPLSVRIDGKANCLVKNIRTAMYIDKNGKINTITPEQAELLQTVNVGYTNIVGKYERYKLLGNAWTVDIITEFFRNIN